MTLFKYFSSFGNSKLSQSIKQTGAGEYSGLELILASEPNEYVSYYKTFYGIQIAIHSKEDYPDLSSPVLVQPGYDMKVLIRPSVLTSEENVIDKPIIFHIWIELLTFSYYILDQSFASIKEKMHFQ